jgi:hypothetical protein
LSSANDSTSRIIQILPLVATPSTAVCAHISPYPGPSNLG